MGELRGKDSTGNRTAPSSITGKSMKNAITTELAEIQARQQMVRQRSAELAVQINVLEQRQAYAQAAMEESQRIAGEITEGAEQRVYKVMSAAHDTIGPQQVEIARLEVEMTRLKRELAANQPEITEPAATTLPPAPAADLEAPSVTTPVGGPIEIVHQQSPTDGLSIGEEAVIVADEPVETQLKSELQKEYSRRDEPGPISASTEPGSEEQYTYTPPMSVLTSQQDWQALYGGFSPPSEGVSNIETRGEASIMHLDAFLDTRHYHFVDPWNKQVHRHRWQIKVQVEARDDSREVIGYSNVLAAVTSTLMRWDQVLLNEVYPFDQLEPSHENIALYFFNCLEDTVAVRGLRLIEVSLWENQTLVLQANCRSEEIDALLRGEDELQKVRDSLFQADAMSSETSFRKMLGMMFKNREGKPE